MRGVFSGDLPADLLRTADFKEVADLCVNCQMCRQECPAGVDIPRLMIEAKAQFVANEGLRFGDWILSRLDLFSGIGTRFSPLANWAITSPPARWFLEKTVGLAQGRKLPRFARQSFVRWAQRRRLTRPTRRVGRKVVYFVDTFANYHDPQIGHALVKVLEHQGIPVFVPSEQTQSGMAMLSIGAVAEARRVAAHNVSLLAEAVRQGYTIVCSEPSAALCLSREYPGLLDDEEARLVASNTLDACSYLWQLHQGGQLQLDLKPVKTTLVYHQPCHMKAITDAMPGVNLMRLVPGLVVQHLERGCSGMAGMFGLKKQNYRNSLRAGWPLISALREGHHQAGTTECSACKIQMEQGSPKPTIHPLKILALAYGLMPEVAGLLNSRSRELTVT
jgi:anaerobic glycerol-3-phosphate dehydrogenase C subunit